MFLRRIGNVVMSHIRDSKVFHTVDDRVFFEIPLYGEKNLEILSCVEQNGALMINTRIRKTSDSSEQTPRNPVGSGSLKSRVPVGPLSQLNSRHRSFSCSAASDDALK